MLWCRVLLKRRSENMKFFTRFIISIALLLSFNHLSLAETVGEIMESVKPIFIRDSLGDTHKGYRCYYSYRNKLIKGGFVGVNTTVAGYKYRNKFISKAVITRDSYVLDESHVESGAQIRGSVILGSSEVRDTVKIYRGLIVSSTIVNNAEVNHSYLDSATITGSAQIVGSKVTESAIKDEAFIHNSEISDSTIFAKSMVLNEKNLCDTYLSNGVLNSDVDPLDKLIEIPEIKFVRLVFRKAKTLPIANLEMLNK